METDYTKLNDLELCGIIRNDHKLKNHAFETIYHRYNQQIYKYCKRILDDHDLAKDIFQETFIRFYRSVEKDENIRNVFHYLLKIARNLCLNEKNKQKREIIDINDLNLGIMDNKMENDEISSTIEYALSILNSEQREVLVLQLYNELSYSEISEVLEIPVTTVRNRIIRAKKRVREIIILMYK